MYYYDGKLHVYQSNEYVEYTIRIGTNLPGVPLNGAIKSIYFYKTGSTGEGPGVYKYEDDEWELTDIGETAS